MTSQPFALKREQIPVPRWLTVTQWAARKLVRLSHTLFRSPAVWVLAAFITAGWVIERVHPLLAVSFALACLTPLFFWAMQFPESYRAHVSGRFRGTLRSLFKYRWRWSFGLKTCGVIARWRDAPLLLRTNSTPEFDRLRVKMIAGQRVEDFAEKADRLAQTFGALGCRVSAVRGRPHWLDLLFLARDPLVKPVSPLPPDPDVLTKGLPIAVREDGKVWRLKLVGSHLLLVGATTAGKSSAIWGIVHQLIPSIQAKLVKLWVLDPKSMGLAAGRQWYDRFVAGSKLAAFATVLNEAVKLMQSRQARYSGVLGGYEPSTAEPLIVVIVDEMAALTAWSTDRRALKQVQTALALLLSQGRAVGVSVIGAVQDPRKDTIPQRGEFPIRIGLRLNEAGQTVMVFGPGAQERGIYCEQISDSLPGVGYVEVDGETAAYRVRFAHVTDVMISGGKDVPEYVQPAPQRPAIYSLPL